MRISMVTDVEPPRPGLVHAQLESLSQSIISGIPIDTYDPYAAVVCQLVKVQSNPSCAKNWTDEEHGWKADVVEICRRRKCDFNLRTVRNARKPQNLVEMPRAYYTDCLVLW